MRNIDRRILYIAALLVMALPLFKSLPLPVAKNPNSLNLYNQIQNTNQSGGRGLILVSPNFSPDTRGESQPQARALMRHMLTAGKKFAIYTLSSTAPSGQELANNDAKDLARELTAAGNPKVYGVDWINLGYRPATAPILAGLPLDVWQYFKKDQTGKPLSQWPIMANVKTAKDLGLVIDISPSATYNLWMAAVTDKYKIPLVLAPTSVMVPDTYPYIRSGQVKGELRGVLGAAEYEALNKRPELGTREMTSVAALDALIIVLIIIGNVQYFRERKTKEATLCNLTADQFSTITIWVASICTLGIYSLLYRENPVYRVFEYLFLGVGAAYGFMRLFQDSLVTMWWTPLSQGQWWWMFPFLVGCLYFTVYSDKLAWMARMLIGTLMGLVAGYQFQQVAIQYFPQVTDSFRPLLPGSINAALALQGKPPVSPQMANITAANNVVFFVTLVSVMTYFFFSFEHKNKFIIGTARLGRWLLMISFGTMFGSTITARAALAVSRLLYLLADWLQVIKR